MIRVRRLFTAAMAALAATPTFAADTEPPKSAAPDKLSAARTHIAQLNWSAAIGELERLNDGASADWNNLMGYSQRKAATPDYAAAERYYDAALRINPRHRGALEYSGELYLITGQLPRAEARLAALDKACLMGCEEYTDLKKAVERYKANGNRYLPGSRP